jgi:putative flippase GtrA
LIRQPLTFVAVGGFQYVLDTVLFGLLVTLGVDTVKANVTSRATAAAAGFVLNRYVTFGQRNDTVRRFGASLARFVALFVLMTALSTVLILGLESLFGEAGRSRIVYKILVELVLAVLSYVLARSWVYRD